MKGQKENLNVFIMDSMDIFRFGLAEVLRQQEFHVSGCGGVSDEAEELCVAAAPDVLLVHVSEREIENHLHVIDRMKSKARGTRILAIVEFYDMDCLLKIAASGCDGYVHSGISSPALVKVIRNLGNDVCIFDRTVIGKILRLEKERLKEGRVESQGIPGANFSPRERKIVELLAEGKNSAAIGKELNLAPGTVKNIVSDMMKRHHFKKRTQLVKALPL